MISNDLKFCKYINDAFRGVAKEREPPRGTLSFLSGRLTNQETAAIIGPPKLRTCTDKKRGFLHYTVKTMDQAVRTSYIVDTSVPDR